MNAVVSEKEKSISAHIFMEEVESVSAGPNLRIFIVVMLCGQQHLLTPGPPASSLSLLD